MGSLIVAFAVGEKFPPVQYILFAMLLGFVAYGLSIFTYIRAQKTLGAAKTSAFYSIAPFMGVFLSFVLLRETLTLSYIAALLIMIAGTAFAVLDTLSQRHAHKHTHTFRHTHNGETHTHTVTHYHEHIHFSNESKHSHKHNMAELEKLISQI